MGDPGPTSDLLARADDYVEQTQGLAAGHLVEALAAALRAAEATLTDLLRNPNLNPYDGDRCVFCNRTDGHEATCAYIIRRRAAVSSPSGAT